MPVFRWVTMSIGFCSCRTLVCHTFSICESAPRVHRSWGSHGRGFPGSGMGRCTDPRYVPKAVIVGLVCSVLEGMVQQHQAKSHPPIFHCMCLTAGPVPMHMPAVGAACRGRCSHSPFFVVPSDTPWRGTLALGKC